MYENIPILIFIICIVTLMYCKKEIMKYKNPSIVQQQMKEKIWSEMIMTVSEEDKNYYSDLLEEIYPECHNCKYLIEVDYLDGDGTEHTGLICNEEHDGLIFIDEEDPRPPCKYKEEATRK